MWWKIKRRKSDILFSWWVRQRRGFKCEKCGRKHDPNSKGFGVSHFWPRSHENTRFDLSNVDVFCNIPCHQYFETHRTEYETWKEEKMGKQEYNKLTIRAHQRGQRDDKLIELWLMKELQTDGKELKPKSRPQCKDHKLKFCSLCYPVKKNRKKTENEQ